MVASRTPGSLGLAILAMVGVVAASNYLVQFPFHPFGLQDLLTWGAFTYPVAFLVTDLTNRKFGPQAARLVVLAGFAIAVVLSIWLATPRIAIASGSAFLVAQMLDIFIFNRLRRDAWWKAPLTSSFLGSIIDTVIFFGLSFAATFALLDTGFGITPDAFPADHAPLLGFAGLEAPRWISWAVGDYLVKMLVSLFVLAPYRMMRSRSDALNAAAAA
ncbi:queuosine precursor transporter [uncultured Cohaesibacter sp.]|uniref:queuosine precursor transporter n=1 Tax=uncultured Cohaesibacter sp. TaxID=1002546 RepID=UPI0029C7898F|nr:queuosine precursor transporter [uncultured Cohaesibacter sp.]